MYTITNCDGKELDKDKTVSVKVRAINTFRRSGQTMGEMNAEVRALTSKDLDDLCAEYNKAGYPTSNAGA